MIDDRDLERLRAVVAEDTFAMRFETVGELGSGGMGRVYKVIERETGRPLAVKVMASRGDDVARFVAEAEVLERLQHPAIVSYVAHGVAPSGERYLAMAWLDGVTLAKRLERGPLAVAEVIELAERIASALEHAHAAGVVHRDVKPSNVLLVGDDPAAAQLIDFGVAKQLDRTKMTRTGQLVGTPGYMAPEQAMGETIDCRVDLFALGCVIYEALTAHAPFPGDATIEVIARVLLQEPMPIASLREDVPERLIALVAALLAKEADDRVRDASSVRRELAAMVAGRPSTLVLPQVERATINDRPPRPAPRRRWPLVAGAVVAIAGAAVAIALSRRGSSSDPTPPCTPSARTGCEARCDRGEPDACWLHGQAMMLGAAGYAKDVPGGVRVLVHACELHSGSACAEVASELIRACDADDRNACIVMHGAGVGGAPADASYAAACKRDLNLPQCP